MDESNTPNDPDQGRRLPEFDAVQERLTRLRALASGWKTLVARHAATFTATPRCRRHRSNRGEHRTQHGSRGEDTC